MHGLRANQAYEPFNRFTRRSLFMGVLTHGPRQTGKTFVENALRLQDLGNPLFDTLYLSLAGETRNYLRATREQFIAEREITRIDVGR